MIQGTTRVSHTSFWTVGSLNFVLQFMLTAVVGKGKRTKKGKSKLGKRIAQ